MSLPGLPVLLRLAGQPVMVLGDGEPADAKRRLLERAGAVIIGEDGDARIAVVAIEDDAGAEAAVARLRARGVLVNATDRPALCDFTLPAIVDRAPALVAVATGGASAGLAAALRQRLEALLPMSLGSLAESLYDRRDALRARWPDPAERRRVLAGALAEGGPLDPLAEQAPDAVARWIDAGDAPPPPRLIRMTLESPDPDELTLRQARQLAQADRVFHRPGVPAAILARARADAPRIACDAPPPGPGDGLSLDIGMVS